MRFALPAVLALLLAGVASAADTTKHNRYKWTDAEGNLHYSDALPAEAVKYGYEIVSPQGVIIKHVDRAKTAEERTAAKAEAVPCPSRSRCRAKERSAASWRISDRLCTRASRRAARKERMSRGFRATIAAISGGSPRWTVRKVRNWRRSRP